MKSQQDKRQIREVSMTPSKKTVRAALLAGLMTLFLAVPVLAQDPSAQPGRTNDNPATQDQQQSQDSNSSQSQSPTDTSGTTDQQDPNATTQSGTDQSTTTTQGQQGTGDTQTAGTTANTTFTAGEKYEVEGNVVSRDADTVTILTNDNQRLVVGINDQTEVKERKRNPFRSAKKYGITNLLPGLEVEIEGRADGSGKIMADKIKLTQDNLRTAMAIETRVNPVERGLAETQQNAERLSGQVNELNTVSNAARGGAVAAQETADKAIGAAGQAQSAADQANAGVRAANERIVSLDNFDIKHSAVVNFKVNSYQLSPEAKQHLDEIAQQTANEKGYMIEVVGFASADGSANYNRRLSQNRADAVVRYLAEEHNVPLRRIITPFGFGELQPVADNTTRNGREQNRRVEVRVLINRGLQNMSAGMQPPTGSSQSGEQGNNTQQNNNLQNNQTQGQFGQTSGDTGNTGNTGTNGNTGSKNKTEEQD
ncbi:MAG: OmpA family protein [Acidobacteria bacterium]|nr:MAG: OmpA family protein [Acidobacteriota bacterium]